MYFLGIRTTLSVGEVDWKFEGPRFSIVLKFLTSSNILDPKLFSYLKKVNSFKNELISAFLHNNRIRDQPNLEKIHIKRKVFFLS